LLVSNSLHAFFLTQLNLGNHEASNSYNSKEDALKLQNPAVNLASLINEKMVSINRISKQHEDIEVPLSVGVQLGESSTLAIGSTAFESTEFVALFIDKKLNKRQVITNDFKYIFTNQKGDENSRFSILFTKGNIAQNAISSNASMYINNQQLNIFSNDIEVAQVIITDTRGSMVQQAQVVFNAGKAQLNLANVSNGIYVVQVQGVQHSFTQKLIINK
jgi:hypothetical protein